MWVHEATTALFRAVWAAVKAGGLAIMLGLVVLVVNHAEMAPQDSSKIGAAGPAVVRRFLGITYEFRLARLDSTAMAWQACGIRFPERHR